ncbi:MAG: Ig-like domain-containing protein [Mycobacterium sp.]
MSSSPGVAWAGPDTEANTAPDPGPESPGPQESGDPGTLDPSPTLSDEPAAGADADAPAGQTTSTSPVDEASSESELTIGGDQGPTVIIRHQGAEHDDHPDDDPDVESSSQASDLAPTGSGSTSAAQIEAPATPSPKPSNELPPQQLPAPATTTPSTVAGGRTEQPNSVSASLRLAAIAPDGDERQSGAVPAASLNTRTFAGADSPIEEMSATPATVLHAAAGWLAGVFHALTAPAPGAPVDSPLMWAVLGLARRQFGRPEEEQNLRHVAAEPTTGEPEPQALNAFSTFSLMAVPLGVAAPVAGSPSVGVPDAVTGVVSGTLNVSDADGDVLTYTVTGAPARGVVAVSSVGGFVYTPSQAARLVANTTAGPDGDSFVVTVSDGQTAITTTVAVPVTAAEVSVSPSSVVLGGYPGGAVVVGNRVYVANAYAGTVSVIDATTNAVLGSPIAVVGQPAVVAASVDGSRVYVAGNGAVSVINTVTNTVVGSSISVGGGQSYGIAVSPDGSKVYVTTVGSSTLKVINTATNAVTQISGLGATPAGVTVNANGTRAYVANFGSNTVTVVNLATNAVIGSPIAVGVNPVGVAVSPDGARVYVANSGAGTVSVLNAATNAVVGSAITVGVQPWSVVVSRDSSLVYVANGNDTVSVINASTNAVVRTLAIDTAPEAGIHYFALSGDGTKLFISDTADNNLRTITLASAATGQAPTVTVSAGSTGYLEQGSPVVVDGGLTVSDADSATLTGATVTLGGASATEALGFTAGGGITGSYNGGTGVLTLSGSSSVANYQAVLRSVTYVNASDVPVISRVVSFAVTDGTTPSAVATKNLTVTAVNDAPVLGSTGGNVTAAPGVPVALDPTITVADPDNATLSGATVTITSGLQSGQDVLALGTSVSGILANYNSATGTLNLTGTTSVANYQTALRAVTYTNTSATPSIAPRTFTVVVTDGTLTSNVLTRQITVATAGNQPPTATPTFGTPNVGGAVAGALNATDPNGDTLTYAVTSQGSQGTVTLGTGGTFTYQPTVAARFDAFTGGPATDSFTVTVSDGVNPAVTVTVAAVPVSPLQLNIGPRFSPADEGEPFSPANVIAGPDGRGYVYDRASESVFVITPAGQSIAIPVGAAGGNQVIALSPDGNTLYFAAGDLSNTSGAVGVYNTNTGAKITDVPLTGPPLSIAAADNGDVYVASLTVQFDGTNVMFTSTISRIVNNVVAYEVAALPSAFAYTTTPAPGGDRLYVTSSDPLSPSTPPRISVINTATGNVTPVDLASQIPNLVNSDASAVSPDGKTLYAFAVSGVNASDFTLQLAIIDVDPGSASYLDVVDLIGEDELGGLTPIGSSVSFSPDGSAVYLPVGQVDESGQQSVVGIAVLDVRDLGLITVTPFTSAAQGFALSSDGVHGYLVSVEMDEYGTPVTGTEAVSVITISTPNATLVVTASPGSTAFQGGGASVVVDGGITVADSNSANLTGATVTITGAKTTELLSFTAGNGITGGYNATTGVLTLTGTSSVANYQAALRSVVYGNTGVTSATIRTITFVVDDGTGVGAPAVKTISVAASPGQAPVITSSPGATEFPERSYDVQVDGGLTLTDPDSVVLTGATITISGVQSTEVLSAYGLAGNLSQSYNAATGTLTLTGTASVAQYQTALRSVYYYNSSANPPATRTISIIVTDGVGTGAATKTIATILYNDPPQIAGTTASVTIAPNVAFLVQPSILVADLDNATLASATVSIDQGQGSGDVLALSGTHPGITAVYDSETGVLTLTGTRPVADYQSALRAVTFTNSAVIADGTGRIIVVAVSDGLADSNLVTRQLTVVSPNFAAPVVTTSPGATTFTEDLGDAIIDAGLTLSDVDSVVLAGATITIVDATSDDQLYIYVPSETGIYAGNYDQDTGTLTLTGSASLETYESVLRSVVYYNFADNLPASRTITFVVTDGVYASAPASKQISITAINDLPVVDTSSGPTAYAEQGNPVVVDDSVTVTDIDATNLAGATVSLGGATASEFLAFTAGNGIAGTYNTATGVLTLSGASSVANYEAALRSVTYQNSSDTPAATRTVTFVVSDGIDASAPVTKQLSVTAVDDPVQLTTTAGSSAYFEQGAPVVVDGALTLTDPDSVVTGATVTITTPHPLDTLDFAVPEGSGITGEYDLSTGKLTFTGTSSVANYQSVLRSVTFANLSETPGTTRTITFTVQTDLYVAPSATAAKTVTLTTVNDAPALQSCSCTVTTNPGAAVALNPAILVDDPDNTTLTGATIAITGGFSAMTDVLALNPSPFNGITATYNTTTGVLSLAGTASITDYRAALRSVTFTSSAAAGATRTIAFTVTDGTLASNTVVKSLTIAVTNQAPIAGTPSYTTNSTTGVVTGSVSFTDPNGGTLTYSAAPPIRGSITIDPVTGAFVYTPSAAARQLAATTTATASQKQDILVVLADDGQGGVTAVGITVNVVPAAAATNDGPIAGSPVIGTPRTSDGAVTGAVVFTDANNDPLRYSVVGSVPKGTVSLDATTGEFTFTPHDFPAFNNVPRHVAAADNATPADQVTSFTIRASDQRGGTADVVVTVPISPENIAPTFFSFQPSTTNASGVVTGAVLFSAGDADVPTFTVSTPAKGTVTISPSGTQTFNYTYTPSATGRQAAASPSATAADKVDAFVLTLNDGHGGVVSVAVTVAVLPTGVTPNSAPSRSGTGYALISRSAETGVTTGTASFSAYDGDTLAYVVTQPTNGTVVVDETTGAFTFTPSATARHAAGAAGATEADRYATFTIVAVDGHGNATPAVVQLPVGTQNATPTLVNSTVGTPNATTGVVTGQVTATDSDGDTMVYVGSAYTAKGEVVVDRATGAFTFTPAAAARAYAAAADANDVDKFDSFTVTAYDNHGKYVSTVITVAIQPSTAPNSALTQTAPTTVGEPDPTTGEVKGSFNLLDLDRDGITYSIEAIAGSRGDDGFFLVDDATTTGAWTFTPGEDRRHEAALDVGGRPDVFSFRWTATDTRGATVSGEVSVLISPANQQPVLVSGIQTKNSTTGAISERFTATDPDGDFLTVSIATIPTYGSFKTEWVGGDTYQWTYTPAAGQPAGYAPNFTLRISDGHGGLRADTRSVNLNAPLSAATPVHTGLSTNQPTDPVSGAIGGTAAVANPAGRTLTYSIQGAPSRGSVAIDSATGAYTFVPSATAREDAAGNGSATNLLTDQFTVKVLDENGDLVEVVPITVPISPLNRRPATEVVIGSLSDMGTISGRVVATDPDGDQLTITGNQSSRLQGQVVVRNDGTFTYTANPLYRQLAASEPVVDYFYVTVAEDHGRKTFVKVVINVPPLTGSPTPADPPRYPPPPGDTPTPEPPGVPLDDFLKDPHRLTDPIMGLDVTVKFEYSVRTIIDYGLAESVDDYYSVKVTYPESTPPLLNADVWVLQVVGGRVTGYAMLSPGGTITGYRDVDRAYDVYGCWPCTSVDAYVLVTAYERGFFPEDLLPGGGTPPTGPGVDDLYEIYGFKNEAKYREELQQLKCRLGVATVAVSLVPLSEPKVKGGKLVQDVIPGAGYQQAEDLKKEARETGVESVRQNCRSADD